MSTEKEELSETVWRNPTDKPITITLQLGETDRTRYLIPEGGHTPIPARFDEAIQRTQCVEAACTHARYDCRDESHQKMIVAGLAPQLIRESGPSSHIHPSLIDEHVRHAAALEQAKARLEAKSAATDPTIRSINSWISEFDTEIARQLARTSPVLGLFTATGVATSPGKNVSIADLEDGHQIIMPWATYNAKFTVNDKESLIGAAAILTNAIESDLHCGRGVDKDGRPTLIGIFNGALAYGSYGGLSPDVVRAWQSTVIGNGGVPRNLTPDLMAHADQGIFEMAGVPWDTIVSSAGITRKYCAFFTQGAPMGLPLMRMGEMSQSVPSQYLAPQNWDAMYYKGRPVVRTRHAITGAVAFLNSSFMKMKFLSDLDRGGEGKEMSGTQIPLRATDIREEDGKTVASLRVTLASAITRRAACALVLDVNEQ